MKYEEIKIGDIFKFRDYTETVISKSDEYKVITTINPNNEPTSWEEDELYMLEPIKKELPEEGLLVSTVGSLVYKLSENSGYGFAFGEQSRYFFNDCWYFSSTDWWKPATPEQKKKFVELLKKECENRGLFEDTKLEAHGINSGISLVNKGTFVMVFKPDRAWNKNGIIFHKGKFATPRKDSSLTQVTKAVKEIGGFTVEQTKSGVIILTPNKKVK